jgi:hypothetical protein
MEGWEEALPVPEEIKRAIVADMEHRRLVADSYRHDLQRMFEEISKDHLITLRQMVGFIAASDKTGYASYVEGVAATTLHYRFNVCGTCGVNHEEELLADQNQPADQQKSLFEQEQSAVNDAKVQILLDEYGLKFACPCGRFSCTEADHLNLPRNYGTNKVICINCGMVYPNLEDRIMKPAGKEGCEGCINKEKWG